MKPEDFHATAPGTLVRVPEGVLAFLPHPLPPSLDLTWDFVNLLGEADRNLSQLGGVARTLPNPHLLIGPFSRREAVLSSRIEGTQASLPDLLAYEASGGSRPEKQDVVEVANYVAALEYGIKRLEELPISLRLIREMHERLMRGVRGQQHQLGEFRKHQNYIAPVGTPIAEARFVPPPAMELDQALGSFEKFIHEPSPLPPLIRVALLHYQFEAIHPFSDGNGRVGRLLITLMLVAEKLLHQPLLYLSAFFERHRSEYYDNLLAVSQRGDWTTWLRFFLRGISTQAVDALNRANRLQSLAQQYRERMQQKRSSAALLRLVDHLFVTPAVTTKWAAQIVGVTPAAAQRMINKLQQAQILREATGRERGRMYFADEIVRTLEEPEAQQLKLRL